MLEYLGMDSIMNMKPESAFFKLSSKNIETSSGYVCGLDIDGVSILKKDQFYREE
jgi:hypothetical protein